MTEDKPESFFRTIPLTEYFNYENTLEFICKELVNDSNSIEGIILGIDTVSTDSIEIHQVLDHAKAYDYVINNYNNSLTSKEILKLHLILMNNIFRIEERGMAGEYRTSIRKNRVHIGPRYGIKKGVVCAKDISLAISFLEKEIIEFDNKTYGAEQKDTDEVRKNILKIHYDFETIHPFNDGNGRTGRLILNWLSLKYLNEFIIIDSTKKIAYYENINSNRQIYCTKHPKIKFYKDKIIKKPEYITDEFLHSIGF